MTMNPPEKVMRKKISRLLSLFRRRTACLVPLVPSHEGFLQLSSAQLRARLGSAQVSGIEGNEALSREREGSQGEWFGGWLQINDR